jgi:hypothetical protein
VQAARSDKAAQLAIQELRTDAKGTSHAGQLDALI